LPVTTLVVVDFRLHLSVMAHDVFIGYAHEDRSVAMEVCGRLETSGIRCWMAPRDIPLGRSWSEAIVEAINESRILILVFSANANASQQIPREVERAANRGLTIIPFRIEDVPPAASLELFISGQQWLDASDPPTDDQLDRLVTGVRHALRGGQVKSERTQFPKLLSSRDRATRRVAVMLSIALGAIGVLAFTKVRTTAVNLDLVVSGLTFTVVDGSDFADGLRADSLLASRLGRVDLPRAVGRNDTSFHETALSLKPGKAGSRVGTIDLEANIPKDTRVIVQKTEIPREFRFVLGKSGEPANVIVEGPIQVGSNAFDALIHFSKPLPISLHPADSALTLDFVANDTTPQPFPYPLKVRSLEFKPADAFVKSAGDVSDISTILGGSIHLEELDGSRSIRMGESLTMEWSEGELRDLRLSGNQIALRFHGRVRALAVGSQEFSRSLMPSRLDQLLARHRVLFLWGTGAYLIVLLIAGARLWKRGS
jgi:hypothetical protein